MARILVAEHNETTSSYICAALKKAGNSIEHVDNCLDAWRLTSKEEYDVLLVDIVMPGIDGFVLAQKALQENPALHVIFITGFAGVAMDTIATPNYAPAPITTRPFHLKDLNARIRYMMGQGSLPQRYTQDMNADSNVIYADFMHKGAERQQQQV